MVVSLYHSALQFSMIPFGSGNLPCCFLADFHYKISEDDSVPSAACLPHEHDETTHLNELG
jgi:hypothetical protein